MRRLIITCILMTANPALADEAAPAPKPLLCGATVTECQKKVDDQAAQITQLQTAYQAIHQQRDQAQSAFFDAQVSAFIASKKP